MKKNNISCGVGWGGSNTKQEEQIRSLPLSFFTPPPPSSSTVTANIHTHTLKQVPTHLHCLFSLLKRNNLILVCFIPLISLVSKIVKNGSQGFLESCSEPKSKSCEKSPNCWHFLHLRLHEYDALVVIKRAASSTPLLPGGCLRGGGGWWRWKTYGTKKKGPKSTLI